MKNLFIKDKDLSNINNENLKLSILFTQNGLSYSIYNVIDNKFLALVATDYKGTENYLGEIQSFLESEQILNNDYKEINIVFADQKVSIVPKALFDNTKIDEIYKLNFFLDDNKKVLYSSLPKSSNVVLFAVDNALLEYLHSQFDIFNIFPQSYSFIEHYYTENKKSDDSNETKMFLQIFDDFIDVLVLKDSELLLYNTFTYKSNNDILYFIINVFEKLKLSQEQTAIMISGFIETDSIAILNLRKFIKLVYFESLNMDYKYFYKFQETSPHYFANLLNLN